jgi:ribosomal protein S12 methylthiotransferase
MTHTPTHPPHKRARRTEKVYLVTFGCPKNEVDSEALYADLSSHGFPFVEDPSRADILVVNTCGFIQEAVRENIDAILELTRHKLSGTCRYLVVVGCLVQRYGSSLARALPEVDLFIGMKARAALGAILAEYIDGATSRKVFIEPGAFLLPEPRRQPPSRVATGVSAYLKVSEGCSNRCSYCTIPSIRGPLESRPAKEILAEARTLAEQGVLEITLIGQDVSAYGRDRSRTGRDQAALPGLIRGLARIEPLRWVRLLYCHPAHVGEGLIETFGSVEKLCPYLDLPIQHVSARILQAMNRPYSEEHIRGLIARLRTVRPDIALRTTVMVGFPGETEDDVEALLAFLEEIEFHHVGAFCYSPEEGTSACHRPEAVPAEEKLRRYRAVMELQAPIAAKKAKELVGTVQDVLVEGTHEETPLLLRGRTKYQAPAVDGEVLINKGSMERPGMARVRITRAHVYDLVGEIEGPA